MKVKMPASSKGLFVVVALLRLIDCKPTTKSRDISLAIVKATSFGTNIEASKPPKVRVPLAFPGPEKDQ